MREIKFRAWNKSLNANGGMIWNVPIFNGKYFDAYKMETHDHPLMQCTGLKDKNGTEIYEGDIVKYGNSEENGTGKVIYDNGSFVFDWLDLNEFSSPIRYFQCANELEIIGNIYENPELLLNN